MYNCKVCCVRQRGVNSECVVYVEGRVTRKVKGIKVVKE